VEFAHKPRLYLIKKYGYKTHSNWLTNMRKILMGVPLELQLEIDECTAQNYKLMQNTDDVPF
jgi:hypothetical protein